ncbi:MULTISPECIES: TetR/AcrR family transcriptional regulator [unclassified Sporosarcina]|uniref:TetR/AcrR family transcriptional regulator n=1 Tax=unclassified Sporosarcina TaxID=2647733 RepID=UPI000C167F2E|nr:MULTISPECIES: TetR/AcrR family transcriptional regulator [unclassified Sporosarcina]PID05290.1 TetR family transcriptional regulator [Sporosarcina sp. P30]PID08408.1 TetR family transcriptional regulator [Sporosarcina sp. P31]PID12264.1 TetR family transcriptional regulator [Sporosarcina sp. P32b]
MPKHEVKSTVKDEELIQKRRAQISRGAVKLFIDKGFHRTTTREIAKEAGFSIGTLYEYIRTKEDVLYLVCDNIYNEVKVRLSELDNNDNTVEGLRVAIARYYEVIDQMSDEFLVMYQESKSLPSEALRYVLTKELEMVEQFEIIIRKCMETGNLRIGPDEVSLTAHHILVSGQMWSFRRWALRKQYTLERYTKVQTDQIIKGVEK